MHHRPSRPPASALLMMTLGDPCGTGSPSFVASPWRATLTPPTETSGLPSIIGLPLGGGGVCASAAATKRDASSGETNLRKPTNTACSVHASAFQSDAITPATNIACDANRQDGGSRPRLGSQVNVLSRLAATTDYFCMIFQSSSPHAQATAWMGCRESMVDYSAHISLGAGLLYKGRWPVAKPADRPKCVAGKRAPPVSLLTQQATLPLRRDKRSIAVGDWLRRRCVHPAAWWGGYGWGAPFRRQHHRPDFRRKLQRLCPRPHPPRHNLGIIS